MKNQSSIYDELYEAILKLDESDIPSCIIVHPYSFQLGKLPLKYQSLGYPLGKNKKGWKKWFRKELKKLQYLNVNFK